MDISVAAPVVAVVTGTLVVSIAWTFVLEKVDKAIGRSVNESDSTKWISNKFRDISEYLATVSKDVKYESYPTIPI